MINTQFMLTKHDVTIPDAFDVYSEVSLALTPDELPYIGFKNIGHPLKDLRELGHRIVGDGHKLVIEIVGASDESEREAAELALETGADILIGGTHTSAVTPLLAGSTVGYYPTLGDPTVEAGRLHGTVAEIVQEAEDLMALPEVRGVMLLAYRFVGNSSELIKEVSAIPHIRIVNAGSVDSVERINELKRHNVWAYTIGSAVLDRSLPAGPTLESQLRWCLDVAAANLS